MADATSIPILVDADTGYGNFNNFRRLVNKLIQRDIAAVCIEDKLFPKTIRSSASQPLADIDEFCGKIKAGKDAQSDDDFSVIARVEALIAGWGWTKRFAAPRHIMKPVPTAVHSKDLVADEILAFAKEWANRSPVVIIANSTCNSDGPFPRSRHQSDNLGQPQYAGGHQLDARDQPTDFEDQNLIWAEEMSRALETFS